MSNAFKRFGLVVALGLLAVADRAASIEPDFCDRARAEARTCWSAYQSCGGLEVDGCYEAYDSCIMASGIWECE
jgi:hypothetical protein